MPQPQTRTRTRCFTACHRHSSEPVTGFCPLCLRDRLAGLDSSASGSVVKTVVCSRRTRDHGVSPARELRRSKSVAADKCKVVDIDVIDQRRKSCDVRGRSSLSDLFVVESMKLGFQDIDEDEEVRVLDVGGDEIRASDECDDEIRASDEGERRPMIEIIETEIELRKKRKNFWEAASIFSQKLRKWREKQKEKKKCRSKLGPLGQFRDSQCQSEVADYGLGRRSCVTEPRFSIDANRLSVDDPRFSIDEHRASCDGYMIARTIPRHTPMLSIVDSTILAPVNRGMNSLSDDGVSSMKCSSTKMDGLGGGEQGKSGSNARVSPTNDSIFQGTKLVITEKELKDWNLNSVKNEDIESNSNGAILSNKTSATKLSNGHKMAISSRLRRVCNLWGDKHKLDATKNVESIPENGFDKENSRSKLVRNASVVNSRNRSDQSCRDLELDRNRSTRYSTSDIESGLLRLHLTPFRNTRGKFGKNRGPFMVSNGFQLN
ncbi:protein OCTOPUS-like [Rutidosis leptorrhynchoides]|uniref:protein OCTOPUS-like n=1 Tax=Rutidosis leptorrhynchoides TaxID=125765 RepID=UPI003A9947AF